MTTTFLLTLSFNNAPLNNPLPNQVVFCTSFYTGIIYLKYLPYNSFNLNNVMMIVLNVNIEPRNLKSATYVKEIKQLINFNPEL